MKQSALQRSVTEFKNTISFYAEIHQFWHALVEMDAKVNRERNTFVLDYQPKARARRTRVVMDEHRTVFVSGGYRSQRLHTANPELGEFYKWLLSRAK